ncbi:MAG TPA: histidine--tRNA ligase [Candidatus Aphodousia gallistercoris]|nr:histidine--tRNA ligase [Candidatus Aphodousia gallistercoris]
MAKVQKINGIRGMNDILPADEAIWSEFIDVCRDAVRMYGYKQIRTPILEATPLFKRGIGEVTDIVEKEMYCFTDSLNGEELSLRPENTAGVVRSVIEHNLTYNAPQRLWYFGPMFRHERPQRGRYRQFHQMGVEALGFKGPDVDVEQILMARRIFDELNILPLKLELNSLGNLDERREHRQALIEYFEAHRDILDEDAQRRLYTNPLRILDTKNPDMQELVEGAPRLLDYLKNDSLAFLNRLEHLLSVNDIEYKINPRLVRGLDYYNHTVYEWITDKLGAQATVCGGGRYDPLVEMLGGRPTPGVGFAMGVERVLEVMRECGFKDEEPDTEMYILHMGGETQGYAMVLGEILRDAGYDVIVHAGDASFKSQMKKADQSGATFAFICGEEEVTNSKVTVKRLFGDESERFMKQETLDLNEAIQYFVDIQKEFLDEE